MIHARMLGQFSISSSDGEITLPTAKARYLAAYLFWQQGKWVRRDFLRGMLWGEVDEKKAAISLRQTIHHLRKALEDDKQSILESQGGSIRIPNKPDIQVDVHIFEDQARAGLDEGDADTKHLIAAASIYQGTFLDGMDENWCLAEARKLSNINIAVLKALVERLESSGLYQVALSYANLWIKEDPLNEVAHQAAIKLYALMGQPARAMEQFEALRQVLEAELGISPSESTINLYGELGLPEYSPEKNKVSVDEKGRIKSHRTKKLSDNALRNASFLVVYGEDKAMQGDIKEGISALKKALSIYEKLGDSDDTARVYLVMGSCLLNTPIEPEPVEALNYITVSLEYYRKQNGLANLCRAMLLAADALWPIGKNDEAIDLCYEGLKISKELNDKYSYAQFSLILGIARMSQNRVEEAEAAIEKANQALTCFVDTHDLLKFVLYRGVLAHYKGELRLGERFIREAIALTQMLAPSPRVKQSEFLARSYLIYLLHLQGKVDEIREIMLPAEAFDFAPMKNFSHPISLVLPDTDFEVSLESTEAWLKANYYRIPAYYSISFTHQLAAQLTVAGFVKRASRWAATGVRFTRARGWKEFEALFYSLRAVALVKQGRLKAAELCCNKTRDMMGRVYLWTPFYLTWAEGLIAKEHGDIEKARECFAENTSLFNKMGFAYCFSQVQVDMKDLL